MSRELYKPENVVAYLRSIENQSIAGMQYKRAADEIEQLRAALVHAVEVIQTWHNMDIRPQSARSELWDIYWKNAPEMKPIRAALKSN
jgi:hypothetical protein